MVSEAGGGNERLRGLPGVDRVIDALRGIADDAVIGGAARTVLHDLRAAVLAGDDVPSFDAIVDRVRAAVGSRIAPGLRSVINATGVLIHTNLGRAPLGRRQLDAIAEIAAGYSNLEYDLEEGGRGSRYQHARRSIATLTGAESALVVNNNAAAVLVALAALCRDKEVVISRGELIEIGGEFRIPEVMAISGARLVEVGTTNRTHLDDYEKAITPETAAILKVHPSNYQVVGFTSSVASRDLVELARSRSLRFIHDVGSGLVDGLAGTDWVTGEPVVRSAIEEGADIVAFSGDKLFGGPQAGIIVGRMDAIATIERHPLLRALRVDKMTLAALEATVSAHLAGAIDDIPLWSLALYPDEGLQERAQRMAMSLGTQLGDLVKVEATPLMSVPGGGSLPGATIPSWGILIFGSVGPSDLHERLRRGVPPVVGRIADDRLILDLRTVFPEQDQVIERAVLRALSA